VNPQEAYLTLTNEYIESVWWAVKSLWNKGLLYQALKVVPYCPSCGVHLLQNEIIKNNEDIDGQLICVRLPLVNGPGTSLLLTTKAPWSLVGNVAVAVHPEVEYVTIEQEARKVDRASGLAGIAVEKIFGDNQLKVVDKFKGKN
jgi:isoleucyl-tRNA synthetase